jgi:TonB family protein
MGGRDMPGHGPAPETAGAIALANERLKRNAGQWFWLSMLVSAVAHAAVLAVPRFEQAMSVVPRPVHTVTIVAARQYAVPSDLRRLAAIATPRPPVLPDLSAITDLGISMAVVKFTASLLDIPVPPSSVTAEKLEGYASFLPSMVAPRLKNLARVRRELERRYPARLRDAGVEGRVVVLMWIDEQGVVQKHQLQKSTGSNAFDRAVEEVIPLMQLTPSLKNGRPVRTLVALPISFEMRY